MTEIVILEKGALWEGTRGPFWVLQKLQMFTTPQKTADSFIIGVACGKSGGGLRSLKALEFEKWGARAYSSLTEVYAYGRMVNKTLEMDTITPVNLKFRTSNNKIIQNCKNNAS